MKLKSSACGRSGVRIWPWAQRARDETNEILREMQRDIKQLLQQGGK
jgi:hypothetical protein